MGTLTAAAPAMARQASTQRTQLGRKIATLSPAQTPRLAKCPARFVAYGILECGLISPLPGLSLNQRGDRRNQIGLQHASSALAVIVVKAC
jgi:hypothetical protein